MDDVVRLSTGINGLDEMMDGGLEVGNILLLTGDAGCGKSTIATSFLMEGLENKEPALYISFQEKKDKFYRNMSRIGFDLEKYERESLFRYLYVSATSLKDTVEKGDLGIITAITELKVKRVVIDSITEYILLYPNETAQRENLKLLIDKLDNWGLTTVMTSENKEHNIRFGVDYLVDGVIGLSNDLSEGSRQRSLEVIKMRGTNHRKNRVPYIISADGIRVEHDQPMI